MKSEKDLIEGLEWEVPVPPTAAPVILICSPKPREMRRALILDERPVGVMTHYIQRQTVKCWKEKGYCEGCEQKLAKRYKGYLAGWDTERFKYVLIEYTHQAALDNLKILGKGGPNLRGVKVTMSRKGVSKNSPLVLAFHTDPGLDMATVPAAFDTRLALLRIWGRVGQGKAADPGADRLAEMLKDRVGDDPIPEEVQGL